MSGFPGTGKNTASHPARILVAEDSATQAQHLQYFLEKRGYAVAIASDGRRALDAIASFDPTLVISDVVMPEMTGYELCHRIKTDGSLGHLPVILVTTLSDPHDVIRGLECGADHFILKPYDEKHLLDRVEYVLANRQMQRQADADKVIEIFFNGQKHSITSDRLQILNLLLSTYEAAIRRNRELGEIQVALRQSNADLQALARDLDNRVRVRTRELEASNEALRRANASLHHSQQAAMEQERLRALGQMASGIAHDINNAISPITLYTDSLIEREPGLSPAGRDQLQTIQRAINDVAQTVARMREFYRPRESVAQLRQLSLNTLASQVLILTKARWSDQAQQRGVTIELVEDFAADLPDIQGADSQIRDALTNLIFNALDAMPEGGRLGLYTGVSAVVGQGGERRAFLAVSDSGCGMDHETRKRCLEPFFTTKGDRGSGLGLPMVYGMTQRHGAELQIDSAPGAGTTVRILFPIRAVAAQPTIPAQPLSAPHRALRLLLVDDDALLLGTLRDVLVSEGHAVVTAPGGQEGIDAFRSAFEQDQPFDAVVTDLGMPRVDGRQVARSIRVIAPQTPIIMLTGWGQIPDDGQEQQIHVDHLLGKPPRLKDLRKVLAGCGRPPPSGA